MTTQRRLRAARGRWRELWNRFGVSPPADAALREILAAYGEEHRHYHGLEHVLDCLDVLERYEHLAQEPAEVAAALWFHDVVYDTRRGDNEDASARWAARLLEDAGVGKDEVDRVRRMVLATRHTEPPATSDEALLLDIDLSILGRRRAAFERYQDQIRREYAWVPDDAFARARGAILRGFLEREAIFRTRELAATYESPARANLEAALGRSGRSH